jgi:hypothetical protein
VNDDYNRARLLHETGSFAEQERLKKQRADEAAKRWKDAGRRLMQHKRKKLNGGSYPWR